MAGDKKKLPGIAALLRSAHAKVPVKHPARNIAYPEYMAPEK
jgi:hypothetical protein